MSTGQKYSGKGNNVPSTPQTDRNKVLTPSASDNRTPQPVSPIIQAFINNNQDLVGLPFEQIEIGLQERFAQNPIRYTNVLDSLALIRAFTPQLGLVNGDDHFVELDCHYLLLIDKKGCFNQLILLYEELDPDLSVNHLSATTLTAPDLLEVLTDNNCNKVLIASSRNDVSSCEQFTDEERRYANDLWETLDERGVKLVDWLIFSPDGNGSLEQQNDIIGRKASSEGVDWYTLISYGTQPVQP